MKAFWSLRIHNDTGSPYPKLEQMHISELSPGEVTVEVHYSSVNYKDALAVTGKGKILKKFPLNAGIDMSGIVLESHDSRFQKGQEVLVNGTGIGESHDGGYSEVIRVSADSVVPMPQGLTMKESMMLGTAGFTAALALHRMEQNGQCPEKGPILITGASGGVGSFATQLFSSAGYEVIAVSGKHEAIKYLKALGAKEVIPPNELNLGHRPLESARYAGAVDNVGGKMLAQVLAHTDLWGNVASIGMAESHELHTTVMPFILRGVSLLGASSNNTTRDLRHKIWNKLGAEWKPKNLNMIHTNTVDLKGIVTACEDLIHRKSLGRTIVEIRK